ncbi:MAG: glycosyltransferase family 39 protein, partial [Clostridia bacterium]|nr:glycosyltransferase family 39 protein [Clostridia bacterium]
MIKTQKLLSRAVLGLFTLIFFWVFIQVMFANQSGQSAILLLPLTACFCGLFYFLYKAAGGVTGKQARRTLLIFMAVSAVIQIYVGHCLRYIPAWDIDAVFGGGRDWAVNGNFDNYAQYYAEQTPNLGGLFIFRCVFWVYHLFGGKDFFMAAVVFATLLLQAGVWALFDVSRRIAGPRGGIMSLVILGLYLPFYTMGAAFYTDALSLPFIMLTFAFFLRAGDARRFKNKLLLFAAAGAFAAVGAVVKFTAMIPFIALVINFLLKQKRWKWSQLKAPLYGLGAAVCAAAVLVASFYLYMGTKLDKQRSDERRVPLTHWVMMGLKGDGGYSGEDYQFSFSQPTLEIRKKAIAEEIGNRVRALGPAGLIRLFGRKLSIDFDSGAFKQTDFFHLQPQNQTVLHDIVADTGAKHFDAYNHISTAML